MQWIRWLLTCVLTICIWSYNSIAAEVVEASHSTSVAGMIKLLQLEKKLVDNLDDYARELRKKLEMVRSVVGQLRTENKKAHDNMEEYLSNPLNAFKLIRRMQRDWIYWQLYMEQPVGESQVDKAEELNAELPSKTDLQEAAEAIYRIQTTYDLEVSHMTTGMLNGRQYNVSFSALDSYAMGQYQYDQSNFGEATHWIYHAIEWFKVYNLPEPLGLNREEVLLVYAETLIKLNRFADALQLVDIILKESKNDVKLMRRKIEIETMIRTESHLKPKTIMKNPPSDYEIGCRGKFPVPPKLYCVYNDTTTPFLRLAPLKMELVQSDPYMVIYHDVISAREISELQEMARPGLKRATVYNHEAKRSSVVKTRTSKVSWFVDQFNDLTKRLNIRINDMSGFNLNGSEMLQVMNYGLGGHYDKHYDFFNASSESDIVRKNGDRIATVLFYLNDVEQGGATVFPNIKQAVFPQRGSAIMWYNLKSNGEGDIKTLHAACPVIVGSKWVCNKWIRERQQCFIRPCFDQ